MLPVPESRSKARHLEEALALQQEGSKRHLQAQQPPLAATQRKPGVIGIRARFSVESKSRPALAESTGDRVPPSPVLSVSEALPGPSRSPVSPPASSSQPLKAFSAIPPVYASQQTWRKHLPAESSQDAGLPPPLPPPPSHTPTSIRLLVWLGDSQSLSVM